jgi:tryptophan 2,3-dioxygenase
MDRDYYYKTIGGDGSLDYEIYLNTHQLLQCQKPYDQLAVPDELQFQIVHQVEELWMKLMAFTLLDIDDYMRASNANRVMTLFRRVNQILTMMMMQLDLLETMSPKEYQEIRLQLGNGSGQESPGFRTLIKMAPELWEGYEAGFLKNGRTLEQVYNTEYSHDDAYMVAESLAEFDELFQKFRYHHLQLIARSIGLGSKSLKGRPVEMLERGVKKQFFPQVWEIRGKMTDDWGSSYGVIRDSITPKAH